MRVLVIGALAIAVAAHPHREGPPPASRLRGSADTAPTPAEARGPRPGAAKLNPQHRVLYVEGMWDNSYDVPTMLADAREVAASNFSTVVLAFMHVNASGAPIYNNIPFAAATTLPQVLAILRAGGVRTILISLGGAGTGSDFDHVAANYAVWEAATVALFASLGIDGIDIDIENGMAARLPTLQRIAETASARNWTLTGAPCCGGPADWVTLVKNTKRADGTCAFSWLHLQARRVASPRRDLCARA